MRWNGAKPKTGVPAAARAERYRLLAQAARSAGAMHILTAHTRDDQAETLLMRLLRGSGIAGLAAMARETDRDGIILARPLLAIPKSRLIATLDKAKVAYADDPTNRDAAFTRPRLRTLLPLLAAEGGDASRLARLAARLARANEAVEVLTDGAERYLALKASARPRQAVRRATQAATQGKARELDVGAFAALPEEIRLRLLVRAINRFGHEGPAELGKVEALLEHMDRSFAEKHVKMASGTAHIRLKQTLAGALVTVSQGSIRIEPAPPRRRK
jgi:tRNA(Ile)-lysidine synthase